MKQDLWLQKRIVFFSFQGGTFGPFSKRCAIITRKRTLSPAAPETEARSGADRPHGGSWAERSHWLIPEEREGETERGGRESRNEGQGKVGIQ